MLKSGELSGQLLTFDDASVGLASNILNGRFVKADHLGRRKDRTKLGKKILLNRVGGEVINEILLRYLVFVSGHNHTMCMEIKTNLVVSFHDVESLGTLDPSHIVVIGLG